MLSVHWNRKYQFSSYLIYHFSPKQPKFHLNLLSIKKPQEKTEESDWFKNLKSES